MNFFKNRHPASYRDPAGFVFEKDGVLYRQINHIYQVHYEKLMSSGLYDELVNRSLLIPHEVVELEENRESYLTIRQRKINVITAPHHWTYDMLKDAASLTLEVQETCLRYGMSLKDAHPTNIQFIGTKPILIDTLSFECRFENEPWIAYRQFCEAFLLPLVIGHYTGPESTKLLAGWPSGIPLKIGINLLPFSARFNFHWALHIYLNGKVASKRKEAEKKNWKLTNKSINSLIASLKIAIGKCSSQSQNKKWINYSKEARERGGYSESKTQILNRW